MFGRKKFSVCANCGCAVADTKVTLQVDTVDEKKTRYFCDYKCLLRYMVDELKKQKKPDDRFFYGKGQEENE